MKQVVVLSVKDFESELQTMLKGLEIPIFSKVDIEGCKSTHGSVDLSNWFASSRDSDFSVMYFAFVPDEVGHQILDAIQDWNINQQAMSPMHAFLQPVERSV
ncbi:MAG: hypothetical protein ABJH98_01440 [Reichenbachiella sp.]|uniref:hypothetical protein n=1 Tax=Reichenbachiella sp. TaxID=2184521 RepID=UPI00329779DA